MTEKPFPAKICMLGERGVGKTSLLRWHLGHYCQAAKYLKTVGADFILKTVRVQDGIEEVIIKYNIWDLIDRLELNEIKDAFFLGALVGVLVFDVTRKETFQALPDWIEALFSTNHMIPRPLMILGNKIDLVENKDQQHLRRVTKEDVNQLISDVRKTHSKFPILYLETSAKTGKNVRHAFEFINQIIITWWAHLR